MVSSSFILKFLDMSERSPSPKAEQEERALSKEEVKAAARELFPGIGEFKIHEFSYSPEGALLELYMRVPGSDVGYQYVREGAHKNALDRTVIYKIDYMGKDSEDVYYSQEIAIYKDGAWVKLEEYKTA
jgi:hypothetical protein